MLIRRPWSSKRLKKKASLPSSEGETGESFLSTSISRTPPSRAPEPQREPETTTSEVRKSSSSPSSRVSTSRIPESDVVRKRKLSALETGKRKKWDGFSERYKAIVDRRPANVPPRDIDESDD